VSQSEEKMRLRPSSPFFSYLYACSQCLKKVNTTRTQYYNTLQIEQIVGVTRSNSVSANLIVTSS
jgi:hypothetical protein